MRIALISEKALSQLDKAFLTDLESIHVPPDPDEGEVCLIGIRDEHGDIYGTIDVTGAENVRYLIGKLRELGYQDEAADFYEAELGFDMVISVLKAGARQERS